MVIYLTKYIKVFKNVFSESKNVKLFKSHMNETQFPHYHSISISSLSFLAL